LQNITGFTVDDQSPLSFLIYFFNFLALSQLFVVCLRMKVLNINQLLIRNRNGPQRYFSDYQFIQKSEMNTYYFQKSLPRLPIPKIEKTLERYLTAQKPILTEEEFKFTEDACKKFEKSGKIQIKCLENPRKLA
jgi:Choline/Carnitine o-acyltransferase